MSDQQRHARARSRGIAHSVASAFAGHNHFRRRRLRRPDPVLRARRLRGGDLLSVPELAALARLPVGEHVPGLRRAGAAAVAPPPQVPTAGHGVRPLGVSDAVAGRPVGLAVPDARHHLWIVGATGVGKSTLLVHGVLADAAAGRAAVVLDPKGDLVTDILARLPAAARARTVVIGPDRPRRGPDGLAWPCLNPLAPATGSGMAGDVDAVGDVAAENVVTIFSRVFSSAWGFRSEDLLRVACLTLRAGTETPSLDMLPALLTNADARAHAIRELPSGSVHTAALREFWTWFERLSEPARAQIAAPLLNKLRAILLRPFAARVLCGPSTVDLTHVLDRGGLLLVRMPKGPLGEDTVRLLGSLIVAQVWQAATARAAQPEHLRRDASLVLDECHNFLNLPYKIEDMLAEARGYRLGLTLSHQYLAQLPPELRDGIATDARSKIVFTSAPEDAARLAKHTAPELGAHDLANLDAFHAAARLLCHGGETRAFTFRTRRLPPPEPPDRHDRPERPGSPSGPPTIPLPQPPRPTPRRPTPPIAAPPEQEPHDERQRPRRPDAAALHRQPPRPQPYRPRSALRPEPGSAGPSWG
ncbi:type IV secretory system conjugative DNA transfer family protein [Pseudonocardia sp. HH130630-07]|uniref:type IV secretory system conjugative DNA transfer family protein n=1 Tax=Pseudonocardia sp. HH130630-07 TaxID=1690815 RepID=UPI0008153CE4|nr:type IV secretion system DNA-binding domain-containing protein [Pseudonocardia sp. HH130630-07]ANY07804.1 hypothetical protein AFB00_17565 [Pseudonocardia sp. HH130630-07]